MGPQRVVERRPRSPVTTVGHPLQTLHPSLRVQELVLVLVLALVVLVLALLVLALVVLVVLVVLVQVQVQVREQPQARWPLERMRATRARR